MDKREQLKRSLASAIKQVLDHLDNRYLDTDLLAWKTVAYYERTLTRMALDLQRGDMSEGDFVDGMIDLIKDQLTRAWNEGMRENDLDPEKDMTDEWEQARDDIILSEFDFVDQFAADIAAVGKLEGEEQATAWEQIKQRIGLWTNRYNEVVNRAKIITRPNDRYKWVYGDTEHCDTCAMLNGIVATGKDWEESGYHPQDPPNEKLECGGWRCKCRLEYTEEKATESGIPNV